MVHLAKENFKFSCSHFTILSAKSAERLHGHNYQVSVAIGLSDIDKDLGFAFDFNQVKPLIREICDQLDERILLASNSRYLDIKSSKKEVEVHFEDRRYVFPRNDTVLMPLNNISSEELARWFAKTLSSQMIDVKSWKRLRVQIEETKGQSVSFTLTK